MRTLLPFTDKVDQVADSCKMGSEFDLPVPATNPVLTATAIHSKTADTTILRHYPPADHEPKAEPATTYHQQPLISCHPHIQVTEWIRFSILGLIITNQSYQVTIK